MAYNFSFIAFRYKSLYEFLICITSATCPAHPFAFKRAALPLCQSARGIGV
jgi:hypothetical protein